ncbi:hypothetical protein BDV96DRAFT_609380 [Lophiotrema nucula]|uniref:ABC transporter domain-containing protein n=1 Tax=Lophiotrema nucula TaxID=690887 RepID=A0A6A5ZQF3_9PLEO|nr:hypothetical protein BDV96DRAFT_609380 [Lophiotrema nucula]
MLLLRQILVLIRKNLLIICARRPISTFIRAIAIPLLVVLITAYVKDFFASSTNWGVSAPHMLRSFKDGMAASEGHSIVGFLDNGMKGGEIASVIESLSRTVRSAGKTPIICDKTFDLSTACASDTSGSSPCYGAIEFLSSPSEGTEYTSKGTWNYTVYGDNQARSGSVNIRSDKNGAEVYQLPLQRAVDDEIISRSLSGSTSSLPQKMDGIIYSYRDQADLAFSRSATYLSLCVYIFGAVFSFSMIGVVYHMTSYVAAERELGMSSLIDTMVPGGSTFQARIVRQISTYVSFATIYLPSWLAVGIVISKVVFPDYSHNVAIGYHILSGLAFCSFSLFGASFFKKAQLSGSIMTIIALVFAILPQVLWKQNKGLIIAFSLIFPSANYTYFLTGLAFFELNGVKVDLMDTRLFNGENNLGRLAALNLYLGDDNLIQRIALYTHLVFLAIQIVAYPILAYWLEHALFSTASGRRSFARPVNPGDPTVTLSGFCKTYRPNILARFFRGRKDVHAVVGMDLNAYKGQILCLLGPNGSGKSTTLNCISGQQRVTSGNIVIDPTGGLGYAPQSNVIWPELTVEEHIRIFSNLKCTSKVNEEIVSELVHACDLQKKLPAKAKTLSGGQKRKLQLAMMFAGGSAVCCVDEVSTGLDPISRRRIWDILLAERERRTIIMTTHFLDEADFIADDIAIMYKGAIKAEGTAATLKHQYGDGYTVKIPANVNIDMNLSGAVQKEVSRHQMVYRVTTASLAAELVEVLERQDITDYQISGPTMEELFLTVTGDNINQEQSVKEESTHEEHQNAPAIDARSSHQLTDGRPISAFKQWWILFCKRFRILKRRYIPYFLIITIAVAGAGVAPLLIKSFNEPMVCPQPVDLINFYSARTDVGDLMYPFSSSNYYRLAIGPADKIDNSRLAIVADIYSVNHSYYGYSGFNNVTQLKSMLSIVNSFEEFTNIINANHTKQSLLGGLWLADPVTFAFGGEAPWLSSGVQNVMNILLSGVAIAASNSNFADEQLPDIIDFKALQFMIYFGLIMAIYPSFFALYPTNERISNVRSMQYSNGIRPLPLWLSHLSFDGIVILIISVVGVALLSVSTPVWWGLGYLFAVMLLYGIVAALISYIISMFAKSPIAAWFLVSVGQIVFYFAYFAALIAIKSTTAFSDLDSMNNKVYFPLALISPIVSLEKAFAIGLGQMAFLCNGRSGGSIYLYSGPICYLVLQSIILFMILFWWDSSFTLPSALHRSYKVKKDAESAEVDTQDLMAEVQRLKSNSTDLHVESVTKSFGKNLAVDNVTFAVRTSEIFALLGPNGAGKSTIISMIRGDIKPSTSQSRISISSHSILTSPVAARATLGVCPQFDSADVLTVTETLRFFAKVRGVKDIDHNVATAIAACGLQPWAHQLAQKLSGGTQRKLSLAVALVGNPRVLVLDEPSSALDANAKRNMWHTLQSVGNGRAVVLTTHSMEEADALADRIGIVSSRMLAVGEREKLKKRAGDAFHVHLVSRTAPKTSSEELQEMKDWINSTFPRGRISRETSGGQIRFEVPAEGYELVGLIKVLEASKNDLGVEFYSVGKATLDEVFENIVKKYGDYGYADM